MNQKTHGDEEPAQYRSGESSTRYKSWSDKNPNQVSHNTTPGARVLSTILARNSATGDSESE